MIYVKELTANDVAYTDGGAQVEFSKKQFGGLWNVGDVTITIRYTKEGEESQISTTLTIPEQGNFYAREYSRRNDNRSPLKEFFKNILKFKQSDIGSLLIFEDVNGRGTDFDLYVYKPKSKNTQVNTSLSSLNELTILGSIDKLILPALRTKPFLLLAGISGTGKSRIVRELAFKSCPKELQDAECTTPGNYCMIEVKPNWHDSTELLGYYSNISKRYVFTKFVKFLVKAMMFPDVPFFVCLDEMNLAPVEQYFAEFLSVLETRKKVGKHIVSGALVDKQFFNNLAKVGGTEYHNIKTNKEVYQKLWETTDSEGIDSEAAESDSLLTVGLTLPDNVFVIGTVNMDDTTHQFSRKVIDRAMTIEMNGGDLMEMFGGSAALSYMPEGEEWSIDLFRPRYVNADEVLKDHSECAEQIKKQSVEKLQDINTLLKGTPFEVSYRVLNELVIYLGNLLDEKDYSGNGGDGDDVFKNIVQEAFDAVTLMKILPRVEGDDEIFALRNDSQNRLQKLFEMFGAESGSGKKLQEMNDRLEKMQFTRFWP